MLTTGKPQFWTGRPQLLSPDGESGGGNGESGGGGNGKTNGQQADDPLKDLPEAARAAMQRSIDAAAKAARLEGERAGKVAAEEAAASAKATADAEAERQRAIDAGNFDEARKGFETTIATVSGEKETLAGKLARAESVITAVLADRVKALEELGDTDLMAAFPKDADPLDQLEWLDDPRTKAAIASRAEADQVANARNNLARVPRTPKPNGQSEEDAAEAEKARLRRSGAYAAL